MATHSSSCWDNPMDWQATVDKVTKSQTGLKRLSAHTWELYVLLFDFSINLKLLLKKIKCIKKKKNTKELLTRGLRIPDQRKRHGLDP